MKSKAILTAAFLAIFSLFAGMPATARAGSPQSHRWEGVAIGIGAAIIGSALLRSMHESQAVVVPERRPVSAHRPHYQPVPEPAGYWSVRKVWIPPRYEKNWNPGHYNRRGRWVAGHWIELERQPGYWVEKKVWVPYE